MKNAIGIDLGGTNIKGGLVNEEGKVLAQMEVPTLAHEGPDAVCSRISRMIPELRAQAREGSMLGVGIGAPGPLNPSSGIIYMMPNLPAWENFPLKSRIEEKVRLPVVVENDANCAALGEAWKGAGQGSRTVILLTLGTGIGGGVLIEGRLVNGAQMSAGEVGHTVIDYNGPKCGCGNHGCLEAFCGTAGIVNRAWDQLEKPGTVSILRDMAGGDKLSLTPQMISEAAAKGDGVALSVLRETGRLLGIAITSMANLFAPEVVILGGGVARAGDVLFSAAREYLRRYALPPANEYVRIVPAALGNNAGLVGAAALLLSR